MSNYFSVFSTPLINLLNAQTSSWVIFSFKAKISFFSRVHFFKIPLKTFFLQFDYFNDINREFFRHPPSRIFRTVLASSGGRGVGWALEAQVRFRSDFFAVSKQRPKPNKNILQSSPPQNRPKMTKVYELGDQVSLALLSVF